MKRSAELVIPSRLNQDEFLARIAGSIDVHRFPSLGALLGGSRAIIGRIDGFQLTLHKRRYYGNSFAPVFRGVVRETAGGSEIVGRFRMHAFTRVFMGVWFSGVSLIAVFMYVDLIRRGQFFSSGWPALTPLAMVVGGIVLVQVGKFFARHEASLIRAFLVDCADGDGAPPATPPPVPLFGAKAWPMELVIRRILAVLWDGVVPALCSMVVQGLRHGTVAPDAFQGPTMLSAWWMYEVVTLLGFGRGLGKKMAQLRVHRATGGSLTAGRAVIRATLKVAALAPLVGYPPEDHRLIVIWLALYGSSSLFTTAFLAPHDMVAGTRVQQVR